MAKNSFKFVFHFFLFTLLIFTGTLQATPRSAIITLNMPVGARQLGMGETGIALADDANAPYYNPAGLAFGPLADEWTLSKKVDSITPSFSVLTAKSEEGFLSTPEIWAGTAHGILHYDGREWQSNFAVPLDGSATIREIVRRFTGREHGLDSLVALVRKLNGIESVDDESLLVELLLPWTLGMNDSVTALMYEHRTDKLWVGSPHGLYRFDGKGWKDYSLELGTPFITALESRGATVWVGTKNGLYRYRKNEFRRKGKVLPGQYVTSLAWSNLRSELYAGIQGQGIARYTPPSGKEKKARWTVFSEEDGLMDLEPRSISVDSSGHVWAAHKGGLSHFNLKKWEQIQFENNEIFDLSVSPSGAIWIGTAKGTWKHEPYYSTAKGKKAERENHKAEPGAWTHYHSGNGLHNNRVHAVKTSGSDVWFLTNDGVERFDKAGSQVAFFFEKLLPALNIPDLFHAYLSGTFPLDEWGTVGGFINFVSFGSNSVASNDGSAPTSTFNSSEMVAALSYGTRLNRNWGFGLNFKFIYSDLSSGATSGSQAARTASYAIDGGFLGKDLFLEGFNFGLGLSNIGPQVYYVDKSQEDPIPLTWKIGVAYELLHSVDHRLNIAADYNREVIYENSNGDAQPFYISAWKAWGYPESARDNDDNLTVMQKSFREGIVNTGMEYVYSNTLALRTGYLYDYSGNREEWDMGLGVLISDVLQVDVSSIKDLGNNSVRDGQTRFSLLFKF